MPTTADVTNWLGDLAGRASADALAAHLDAATTMVRSYTRGAGFDDTTGEPNDELAAVIVSLAARSVLNPTAVRSAGFDATGEYSEQRMHAFPGGFTLLETVVLNRYRLRTA